MDDNQLADSAYEARVRQDLKEALWATALAAACFFGTCWILYLVMRAA